MLIWPSGVEVNWQFLEDLHSSHGKSVRVLLGAAYPDKYARREGSHFHYRASEVRGLPCCVPGGVHAVWTECEKVTDLCGSVGWCCPAK